MCSCVHNQLKDMLEKAHSGGDEIPRQRTTLVPAVQSGTDHRNARGVEQDGVAGGPREGFAAVRAALVWKRCHVCASL